jgi:putative membrane protein
MARIVLPGEIMKQRWKSAFVGATALVAVATAMAQQASQADRDFVAKVSQGGMYEVEAGKVAAARGTTPVVRNFGVLEAHDHEGVGANLKRISGAAGVTFSSTLNPEFSARLAKLKAVSAEQFDAYYWDDMKQIHNKDHGLFVQETNQGSASYHQFAHETAVLVAAHLGWLNTM